MRVSPVLPGDISPSCSPPWYSFIKPPSREEWDCMVEAGYRDAEAARETLVAAGLEPREEVKVPPVNPLDDDDDEQPIAPSSWRSAGGGGGGGGG